MEIYFSTQILQHGRRIKKATERFVFEPNTANTWVRVQTMIENFLNQQWQDGALAGSKPEEAYYVSVGLNKTMSAQDILEGRMSRSVWRQFVRQNLLFFVSHTNCRKHKIKQTNNKIKSRQL
jgi:phage tail sheath protein FI